ncbi:transposase [Embleya sp. NPDC059237]|uniref:transposase n=1 Tax=Embleya sp. NPDC059237 TaxID=3346784 RepID=UPI0036A14DC1
MHAPRPGFTKEDLTFDRDNRTAIRPRGITSPPWKPTLGDQQPRFSVVIPKAACRACKDRFRCTGNTGGHGRHPTLMPRLLHEVQSRARRERQTPEWRRQYAMRAGCEATISETVRAHGIRTVATVASPRHTSNTSSPPPAPTPSGSADAYSRARCPTERPEFPAVSSDYATSSRSRERTDPTKDHQQHPLCGVPTVRHPAAERSTPG